jgi:MYXO-CTERM domain-containing protein
VEATARSPPPRLLALALAFHLALRRRSSRKRLGRIARLTSTWAYVYGRLRHVNVKVLVQVIVEDKVGRR